METGELVHRPGARVTGDAMKISTQRYVAGTERYHEVLDVQLQLFPAENILAQIELDRYLVIVPLHRAQGGGWQVEQTK